MLFILLHFIIVTLAILAPVECKTQADKLVRVESGFVRGFKASNSDVFTFYGIPYATAPTGRDRFKAPHAAPAWLQPLDAIDNSIICPQVNFTITTEVRKLKMQEDCLVVNLYVPDTEHTNLSVAVVVHGGGYQVGYGDLLPLTDFVKERNIIGVTFNYRVGIHGFLCLGTEDAPGNAGMKDQVALLRWVQRNIANFGGNPKDVTIIGYSAGSSAVDLLMLSKSTKGLFNRVIPESGANVAPWSVQIDPLENAKRQAREFNSTNVDDVYALGEFYTTISYELLTSYNTFFETDSTFLFSPCVEIDIGQELFLDDNPVNILKTGKYDKVPILYGFTNMEGLLRISIGYQEFKDKMNENFSDFLPVDMQFDSEEEKKQVASRVKRFYFGDKDVGDDTELGYINFFTDILMSYPHLKAVKLHVEAGHDQVYLYEYSYLDEGQPKYAVNLTEIGADHTAQTRMIYTPYVSSLREKDKQMKYLMRELWTNFIKTGKPVVDASPLPAWPPTTGADGSPYMSLDSTSRLVSKPLLERRARLWHDIYEKHYRAPAPPPPAPRYNKTYFPAVYGTMLRLLIL